jgi:hypothetical protein
LEEVAYTSRNNIREVVMFTLIVGVVCFVGGAACMYAAIKNGYVKVGA